MHRNYYLFREQVAEIKPEVIHQPIRSIFTYRKNELALAIGDDRFLKVCMAPHLPYLLLDKSHNTRAPKFHMFEYLFDLEIQDIYIRGFDKCVHIKLKDYIIEAVFYGKQPNVFIKNLNQDVLDRFKESEQSFPPSAEGKLDLTRFSREDWEHTILRDPNKSIEGVLMKHFGGINKKIIREILLRSGLKSGDKLKNCGDDARTALFKTVTEVGNAIDDEGIYLYWHGDHVRMLTLLPFYHIEHENAEWNRRFYHSVNQTWKTFVQRTENQKQYEQLRSRCENALKNRRAYVRRSLSKIEQSTDLHQRKADAEMKGNLLLTFKQQIPENQSNVTLDNIFSESDEKVTIKLNPNKSIVENANQYFNKFKNIERKKHSLEIKRRTTEQELSDLDRLMQTFKNLTDLKSLKKFHDQLVEMHLIQDNETEDGKNARASMQYIFHHFILDNEWHVYVGKNASNNELLTFKFANKWDVWLHAQSVTGSHVIIRLPKRDRQPPRSVIKQAAEIAAAYSKAKHSSTVPVIYTEARYVQRIRKAPVGTVKVQRENVIFVEPLRIH